MVTNRKSVRIDDAHKDDRSSAKWNKPSVLQQLPAGIPLITKNKVVGVLEVLNKKRAGSPTRMSPC